MICKLKLGRGEIAKTWEILTGTPPDLVSTSYPYGAHRFTLRCCAHNFKWCAHLAFRMELVYSNKPSNEINKNNKIGYRDRIQKRDRGGGARLTLLLSPLSHYSPRHLRGADLHKIGPAGRLPVQISTVSCIRSISPSIYKNLLSSASFFNRCRSLFSLAIISQKKVPTSYFLLLLLSFSFYIFIFWI